MSLAEEEDIYLIPRTGVLGGCQQPHGLWELNPDPQEHLMSHLSSSSTYS